MYVGEMQVGDLLTLQIYTTSGGAGALPDDPPRATVYSTTASIESHLLPIHDERNVTGRFWHCIPLDSKYSEGQYWVHYIWSVSGVTKTSVEAFRIVAGGNQRGTGISMEHFRRPPNDFILLQTDANLLLRKKNPEVTV